jgi:hypothetical protein
MAIPLSVPGLLKRPACDATEPEAVPDFEFDQSTGT